MSEGKGAAPPLNQRRQVVVDTLCEHFANDVMSVEEFERRVETAHRATTADELKSLLQDLPGGDVTSVVHQRPAPTPAPRPEYRVTDAAHEKEREFVVAVMGGSGRKGAWRPARTNFAVAVMGGAELDFRDAVMSPGVTELQIYTMWGGVEVIVPPGLNVESHGFAIMGGFEHAADGQRQPDPNAPTLRIKGLALMGGVDVTVRLPGESARDARRRRKFERKERKRLHSGKKRGRNWDDD